MRARLAILLLLLLGGGGVAAGPAQAARHKHVYYTDFNSGPAIRQVYLDGNRNVRNGPFRHWVGWGKSKARATSRTGSFRVRAVLTDVRRCRGLYQYRTLRIFTYEHGHPVGRFPEVFRNRACR